MGSGGSKNKQKGSMNTKQKRESEESDWGDDNNKKGKINPSHNSRSNNNNGDNDSLAELEKDIDSAIHNDYNKHNNAKHVKRHSENGINNKVQINNVSHKSETPSTDWDADAEEERILNEYNRGESQQQQQEYPETYAQRMARQAQQDDTQDLILGTQKPQGQWERRSDEWKLEENIIQGFDANKFKVANTQIDEMSELNASQCKDEPNPTGQTANNNNGANSAQRRGKKPSTVKYDVTEEELMADIEKEFEI